MSMTYGDKSVTTLRSLVAVIERELGSAPPDDKLRIAWTQLVEALALGPAPELRECTTCNNTGMRTATRCMFCWSVLPPLGPVAAPSAG